MRGILLSGGISAFFAFFVTPVLIRFLAKRGYGQIIRDDGPTSHHVKRGTPTMGGLVLIAASLAGYFGSHLITGISTTTSALLVIGLIIGLGIVGFIDDYLKVAKQRSLGLNAKQKLFGQAVVAGAFGYAGLQFPDQSGLTPVSSYLSTFRDTSIKLSVVVVIIWVIIMVLGTSNGVNLTDGLDGLATGAAVMVFTSFILIGLWEFGQSCAVSPGIKCYEVRDPLDLAVLAAALAGACGGFLWWNASPAKIFMGDVGSLALGGALAGIAITLRTQLLLVLLGFIFVLITASVIIQVLFFKITGGKRVFKMAPLQHHFELMGWGEVTIVIRFGLLQVLALPLD